MQINVFSPGSMRVDSALGRDPMHSTEAAEIHERKLREYFEQEDEIPEDPETLFVAFAEIYFDSEHLEQVGLYYDFMDWDEMKNRILQRHFDVPDVRSSHGINEARKLLLEGGFSV